MPELNIPVAAHKFHKSSFIEIISVMCYPKDQILRDYYKANLASLLRESWPAMEEQKVLSERPNNTSSETWRYFAGFLAYMMDAKLTEIFSQSGGIPALRKSPAWETIKSRTANIGYQGILAGTILSSIWRIEISGNMKGGSVNKAIFLIQQTLGESEEFKKYCKNNELPFFEKFLRQTWSEFKSVSHLWAAHVVFFQENGPLNLIPLYPNAYFRFISLAEKFRKFGINHIPTSRREPILSPEETWFPPIRFPLMNFEFKLNALWETEKAILENYRAPQK